MVADPHPSSTGNFGPIGPYRVIQRLGAGGMGEVVLAQDDRLDRRVAIKRLHDGHAATPERREAPGGAPTEDELAVEARTLALLGREDLASAAAALLRTAELLARGPRPVALYTAVRVHAYLGNRELAARYATVYLDGGGSPADLASSWFDDLRRDPGLGPRLAAGAVARTCEAGTGH